MMRKRTALISVLILSLFLISLGVSSYAAEKSSKKEKAAPAADAAANAKQEKVAVVNGTVISKAEYDAEVGRYERQMSMTGRTLEPGQVAEMKKKILDGLVDRELLIQQSKKQGVKVTDTEIDEQIATLKKRFPSEQEFAGALTKMNMTEATLKAQFGQDMAVKKMIDQDIASKITISDEDSKTFYDGHPDLFKTPERVRASHILVKIDPKASDEDKAKAREKMVEIQKRVKNGEDFATVAKEVSDCPSKAKGGDLDYFQRGQMVGPFEEAAFSLQPGVVSDIVETQFGFHLIKVADKKEPGVVPFDEMKEKIQQHLKQEKVNQELTQYVAQLKTKAKIETFVK